MVYPQASYDYLAQYDNEYANQCAELCKEVTGQLANVQALDAHPELFASCQSLLQFYVDYIQGNADIDYDYPDNTRYVLLSYKGDDWLFGWQAAGLLSRTGQVMQMCPIADYKQPMLELFNYWIAQ